MRRAILLLMAALTVAVAPVAASEFVGCNGTLTLSFAPAPAATRTLAVEPVEGYTTVEVYGSFRDLEPMEGPGGAVLAIGGFEFSLAIAGAEPLSVAKKVLVPHRDFGPDPRTIWAGVDSAGERVDGGPLDLVRWTVTFAGRPENVRFSLDPAGLLSCDGFPACGEADVRGMYVGALDVGQHEYLWGLGCAPAVLNPTGEPDLASEGCTLGFAEVGVFAPR